MNKKFIFITVAAMTCMLMAGCGKDNSKPKDVETTPTAEITAEPTAEEQKSDVDILAEKFNVELADNQYIITANEEEAIVLTAPEGFKFETRYSSNNAYLVSEDYSESYIIYDCTGTLTKESLAEMEDVQDMGDGCYIEKKELVKAYCFKDDASVAIVYNNTNGIDVEQATANIKSLVEELKICK